jgi:hypothetical protein
LDVIFAYEVNLKKIEVDLATIFPHIAH